MTSATPSPKAGDEVTADDLRQLVQLLDLVPIPEALMPRVLAEVRLTRAALQRFAAANLDLSQVMTAQPYRVVEADQMGRPGESL